MVRNKKIKVLSVVGARPNFIKIAPLLAEFKNYPKFKSILVHTGQHYDFQMSEIFFKDLDISKPDYNLGIGSGSQAEQTGKIMIEFEKVCLKERPDLVIVVGDVNSTLAGALVAAKLHIPLAHIEAGLRSFDRSMPEEINRILTDQISDYLFVSDPVGIDNLKTEGINNKKIFYVGNIMIDSLKKSKVKSPASLASLRSGPAGGQKSNILIQFNLKQNQYAVLTLHRPSNVDDKKVFEKIINILSQIQEKIKIIWLLHPRTKKQITNFTLESKINKLKNIYLSDSIGYLDMLALLSNSRFVMTDSGGIQEETTFLKIPCLTLRENTERPITTNIGTNTIVGTDKNKILKEVNNIFAGGYKKGKVPKYWDGQTAKRILKVLNFYY